MRLFFISSLVCFFSTFLSPSQILVFEPIGRFGPLCVVIVDRTSLSLSLSHNLSLSFSERETQPLSFADQTFGRRKLRRKRLVILWAVMVVKWSACSPSTATIRVRIPLKSTVFFSEMLWKKRNMQKESGDGPFKISSCYFDVFAFYTSLESILRWMSLFSGTPLCLI